MPEIYPRITYSPEGVLELKHSFDGVEVPQENLEQVLKPLDSSDDYELIEQDKEYTVRTSVPDLLPAGGYDPEIAAKRFEKVINNLSPLVYADPFKTVDYVFSLKFWNKNGATGVIYPHMQRWMNADLFNERIGAEAFDAMALPYGPEKYDWLKNGFVVGRYLSGVTIGSRIIDIGLREDNFGVRQARVENDAANYLRGSVKWRWPGLTTLGSCACWGVDGMDRSDVLISPEMTQLYEMHPHNIDGPLQSLSLVLGMGSLAYEAAKYDGEEDILAGFVSSP